MFSHTSLQEFLIKYNIVEDRAIKTTTLNRIDSLQAFVELTTNQTIDYLILLFQNNNLNWHNTAILVELRGASLQGTILKKVLEYIPALSKQTVILGIQGNKNSHNLDEFMTQFLFNNNLDYFNNNTFANLITKKAVIFSEIVNSGITISNEAQVLKQIGFEKVEVWTIAKTERGNLPKTRLDNVDNFFWGSVIPREDNPDSYCILTSTDAWSSGIMRMNPTKQINLTKFGSTQESEWAKTIINQIINTRIVQVVNSIKLINTNFGL